MEYRKLRRASLYPCYIIRQKRIYINVIMEDKKPKLIDPIVNNPLVKKGKSFYNQVIPFVLGFVGLLVVILIIGLGALLAGRRWDPYWNPFKPHLHHSIQYHNFKN